MLDVNKQHKIRSCSNIDLLARSNVQSVVIQDGFRQ